MVANGWQAAKVAVRYPRRRGRRPASAGRRDRAPSLLRAGGNAVDAAIATSLALGVLEPWMSGLGGGGCMLLELADGRAHAVDAGMVAPRRLVAGRLPPGRRCRRRPVRLACRRRRPQPARPAGGGRAGSRRRPAAGARAFRLACRCASWWRPPWRWPRKASSSTGSRRRWSPGAACDLRRYPDAAALWLPNGLPPVPPWTGAELRLPLDGSGPRRCGAWRRRAGAASTRAGWLRSLLADCRSLGVPIDAADLAGYQARLERPLRRGLPGAPPAGDARAVRGRKPRPLPRAARGRRAARAASTRPRSNPTPACCCRPTGSASTATGRPRPAPRTSASSIGTATWWP